MKSPFLPVFKVDFLAISPCSSRMTSASAIGSPLASTTLPRRVPYWANALVAVNASISAAPPRMLRTFMIDSFGRRISSVLDRIHETGSGESAPAEHARLAGAAGRVFPLVTGPGQLEGH